MKYSFSLLFLAILMVSSSFTPMDTNIDVTGETEDPKTIQWKDFRNFSTQDETNDKKYFVYVYTDWCGYCKKMTGSTFQDEEVVSLLNEKFIPVKFNAESKDPVQFRGHEFKFVASGSRGYHEFAAALTQNRLSYPTVVFLDEKMNMIQPLPGYRSAQELSIILRFLGDRIYEKMSFEEYSKQQSNQD